MCGVNRDGERRREDPARVRDSASDEHPIWVRLMSRHTAWQLADRSGSRKSRRSGGAPWDEIEGTNDGVAVSRPRLVQISE